MEGRGLVCCCESRNVGERSRKFPKDRGNVSNRGGAADVTRLSRPLAATTGWGRPRVTPSKPSCPTWTIRSTRLLDDATCCLVLSQQNLHSTVTQRGKRRSSHPLRAPPRLLQRQRYSASCYICISDGFGRCERVRHLPGRLPPAPHGTPDQLDHVRFWFLPGATSAAYA